MADLCLSVTPKKADTKALYEFQTRLENCAGGSWPKGRQSTLDATYHYLDLRLLSVLLSIPLYPHDRVP